MKRFDGIAEIVERLRAAGCVFAEDEAALLMAEAGSAAELEELVARRVDGLPLEHVVGWAEFCGQRVLVGPGVFVPRSELLVREAVRLGRAGDVVVDLCCGSGGLGLVVALELGGVKLYAADVDPGELVYARRNVARVGGQVFEGDLFVALPVGLRGRVDVLVANVPYVPTAAIALLPREARLYEPLVALDGGTDGLEVLRRVAAEAASWLAPGGSVLMETSEKQAEEARAVVAAGGLAARVVSSEELGATVIIGSRP